MATHAITDVAIVLRLEDDAAVAKREIPAGTILEDAGGSRSGRTSGPITRWRAARAARATRSAATARSSAPATEPIAVGDHVHTQNLGVGELSREYEIGTDVRPVEYYPPLPEVDGASSRRSSRWRRASAARAN